MQTAKEKMSNYGTTVKEGIDKAKVATQEKIDKINAHNPEEKEIAGRKKEARQYEAEMRANVAKAEHRAVKEEAKHKHSDHARTDHHTAGNLSDGNTTGPANFTGVGTPGTL